MIVLNREERKEVLRRKYFILLHVSITPNIQGNYKENKRNTFHKRI